MAKVKGSIVVDIEKCKGCGYTEVQNGEESTKVDCVECRGTGQVRTDSLHRVLTLDNGDALSDATLPSPGHISCVNENKTCGAGCAAFDVRTNDKGDKHYACCAMLPNHIIGVIENE